MDVTEHAAFHAWSITKRGPLWLAVWEFCQVRGGRRPRPARRCRRKAFRLSTKASNLMFSSRPNPEVPTSFPVLR